ncbi:putative membrane lipoprotein isoform X2 [Wolffia australiana]
MIIKGLFRRYERWNPVHPTVGAFWGMGIGVGCGVGWGPGFGPDVIGYVGAGCGVGFSVGLTIAGIGIGLPANSFIEVPYNVTIGAARFIAASSIMAERWNQTVPQLSYPFTRDGSTTLTEPMKSLSSRSQPVLERLDSFINTHITLWGGN